MIDLKETADYVVMILVAAGVGAIGGLAAELLLERSDNTGTVELPGRIVGTRFLDIGFPASLLIGAIAAASILYFFPPTTETVTPGASASDPATTVVQFDLVKLVALSLIVGSAGPRFLAAAQNRVLAAVNEQKAGAAVTTGTTQVSQMAESAQAAIPAAVASAIARHIPQASADEIDQVTDAATSAVHATMEPQVAAAQVAIQAAVDPSAAVVSQ
jgi:hypothetical protein